MPNYSKTFIETHFRLDPESPTGVTWLKNCRRVTLPPAKPGEPMQEREHSKKGILLSRTIKRRLEVYAGEKYGNYSSDRQLLIAKLRAANSKVDPALVAITKGEDEPEREYYTTTDKQRKAIVREKREEDYAEIFAVVKPVRNGGYKADCGRNGFHFSENGSDWRSITDEDHRKLYGKGPGSMRYIFISTSQNQKEGDTAMIMHPFKGFSRKEIEQIQIAAGFPASSVYRQYHMKDEE